MRVEDIKSGDKIVIDNNDRWNMFTVCEVKKVTDTQITLVDGRRFSKKSRKEIGTSFAAEIAVNWNSNQLTTIEEVEAFNKAKEIEKDQCKKARLISDYGYQNLKFKSIDVLNKIIELLEIEE